MKLSFFDWIREGVRQSVLLGIADAADNIGSAAEAEALQQNLLASIQDTDRIGNTPGRGKGRSRRKALGRSLTHIMSDDKATDS